MKNVSVFEIEVGQVVYIPARKTVGLVYMIDTDPTVRKSKTVGYTNERSRKAQVLVTPTNTLIECRMSDIEPLASDVFEIGQEVESLLGGGFAGKVTAIEKESNRVICMSDKLNSYSEDRTRWSYKLSEIVPVVKTEFRNLERYLVNDKVQVIITGHPVKSQLCNMMDCATGALFSFSVPRRATPKQLKSCFGINSLIRL